MKTKSSTLSSTKKFVHTIIKKLDSSTYYYTSNNKKQKLLFSATTATATETETETETETAGTVQRLIVGYDEDSDDYDDYFSSISNRSSGRQQDENKLHTRSRHISFHKVVQVHPIISALELLSDEIIYSGDETEKKNDEINEVKQLLWYRQNEYDSIKRKNHNFIQDIKDGVLICNTTPQQYTIRGLEHHLLSSDNFFVHKFITIRPSVVLKEQEQQTQRSHHLANRYKIRNERNIKDAIQRGIMDHQEAISSN
ncbi:hypothetical protein FRACYDRAFT_247927 [Fragilariopsis cylindrus CCMP1102]|uniref:Uncharacterized protein n=1 Tax=Fragilariopsis cylindrus CCMP1102 TaxID=635003 RepID=A0A1E7EUM9_9STRA|nr:hypothetical protein FRACYDRAFT_247927 [Fragilariopsis cylindrus CCMP1102]|eukprot:OEU09671.1 hypothetical protein FRACYDRAFT_247927 [Fragilariopsis cylindrus CCMP1102]